MGGVTDITAAKIRAGERPPLTLQDRNVPPPTYLSLNDDGTSFPIQQPLDLDLSSLEGFSLNPVNISVYIFWKYAFGRKYPFSTSYVSKVVIPKSSKAF